MWFRFVCVTALCSDLTRGCHALLSAVWLVRFCSLCSRLGARQVLGGRFGPGRSAETSKGTNYLSLNRLSGMNGFLGFIKQTKFLQYVLFFLATWLSFFNNMLFRLLFS